MAEAAAGAGGMGVGPGPAAVGGLDAGTRAGRKRPLHTEQFAARQRRVVGTFASRMGVAASGAAVDLLEADEWWDPERTGRVPDGRDTFKAAFPTPRGTLHFRPPKVRGFLLRLDSRVKQAGPDTHSFLRDCFILFVAPHACYPLTLHGRATQAELSKHGHACTPLRHGR
jgi:hypothetical protein